MNKDELPHYDKDDNEEFIDEESFWSEGSFVESMSSGELQKKMNTFHKKHDEDINFNCKKCNKKISAHNKDWHNGMCDECFNHTYNM